ncbi:MAG: flavin reductase family protein [Pelagimonas sp.]|jgi:flavin reductase (DIM6/NTAB) family NADH-FMN oxidoreductase RutF|nr:flavin reductase family protein [Pelagimonas sp.]
MSAPVHDPATQFTPDPDNPRQLRDAFGRFATGVTVVTAATPEGPVAITANSFSSVSLDPPLVLWAPGKSSRRFQIFAKAPHFAIHILHAGQSDLCWGVSKDAAAVRDHVSGTNLQGVPLLDDCLARFECDQHAVHNAGDHALVVGLVTRAMMRDGGQALAFFDGKMGQFTTP